MNTETQAAMLAMLERVVRINSHTPNKAGSDAVGRIFEAELQTLGFVVERVPHTDVGDTLVARSPAAVAPGAGQLLLCGHMDTVFPQSLGFDCFERFKHQGQDAVRGPGVIDMKGGLVVALFAIRALSASGDLEGLPLCFVLNADEEIGSPHSRASILTEARRSACALVFECAGLKGEAVTARKGKRGLRLICQGRAGHVGQAETGKPSAILELAHKIVALEARNAPKRGISVNVGRIEGGTGANTVPESAEALVDCRFVTADDGAALAAACGKIVRESMVPGVRCRLEELGGRPPMEPGPAARELYEIVRVTGEELGLKVPEERRGGVSDANDLAAAGVPVLDGLGPVGDRDHSSEEYMLVESLFTRTRLAAAAMVKAWERFGKKGACGG